MDWALSGIVRGTCCISEMAQVGLRIQHGGKCGGWGHAKHNVELVQFQEIPSIWKILGNVAWIGRRMDHNGYEFGIAGFPSLVGMLGCSQLVASGDRSSNYDLVQVSTCSLDSCTWLTD